MKIKKRLIIPFLAFFGLVAILGQGSFSLSALPKLILGKELFSKEGRISISVASLTSQESEKYLHGDVLKWDIQPIQISIENQSPDPYLVNIESIGLPLVSSKKVAGKFSRGSLPAAIGFKIAGFLFWPFSIPSTMHGVKSLQAQQATERDLLVKSIKEELIAPYSTMNRVFFVEKKEIKDSFYITLVNQETLESKVFQVEKLSPENPPILDPLLLPLENYYLTHEK